MHSIGELKSKIESELTGLAFNSEPRDLYEPIIYMLSLDAKRMRPVLVLCGCELFNGNINDAISPALGIEVFHNFTLLHDDIMDNAPLRRSKQTVHSKWNPNVAILSGDTMFVKACQLMMKVPDNCLRDVINLFHTTAIEVCEGQQMDMDFENREDVSIDEYISMITFKTAVLLGASLRTGAVIAGASHDDAGHLYEFGKNIGIAFQLKDDLLDVYGEHTKFGKVPGGDILANKKTYLWLKAFETANADDKELLKKWSLYNGIDSRAKVENIKSVYSKLNIPEITGNEMNNYFLSALNHLDAIGVPDDRKKVLRDMAGKLMVREV